MDIFIFLLEATIDWTGTRKTWTTMTGFSTLRWVSRSMQLMSYTAHACRWPTPLLKLDSNVPWKHFPFDQAWLLITTLCMHTHTHTHTHIYIYTSVVKNVAIWKCALNIFTFCFLIKRRHYIYIYIYIFICIIYIAYIEYKYIYIYNIYRYIIVIFILIIHFVLLFVVFVFEGLFFEDLF